MHHGFIMKPFKPAASAFIGLALTFLGCPIRPIPWPQPSEPPPESPPAPPPNALVFDAGSPGMRGASAVSNTQSAR
jgi:hypothetical protein